MTKRIDLTGQRFGKLVVLEFAETRNGVPTWHCQCDCGNKTISRSNGLRHGRIQSCGCLRRGLRKEYNTKNALPYGVASKNMAIAHTKRGAANRGIEWNISDELVFELMQQNCFYCGGKPKSKYISGKSTGLFFFNGIDRVDNSKGYIPGNVVPCCKHCNIAKSTRTVEEFLDWIEQVYKHSVLKDEE